MKKIGIVGEETKLVKCDVCGKGSHIEEALFCTRCGSKLDLTKVISRKANLH